MSRFTVHWDDQVQADFVNAWVKADSPTRTILTDLANAVDAALAQSPESIGRFVPEEGGRVVTVVIGVAAVSVFYQTVTKDRSVLVLRMVFRRA
ncbi:MAG TPA: hypothetical protein VFB96_08975 [Pirellulaceae bacterium]|nr:hypothetical protein [Pirellulaceae bacterium]